MGLQLDQVKQIGPMDPVSAQVYLSWTLTGKLPDFVQIYARLAGDSGQGVLKDNADVNPPDNQGSTTITLLAGAYYEIFVCPRNGSKENPEDTTDGLYWEAACELRTIVTQATEPAPSPHPPPRITALNATPRTLNGDGGITVQWTSSRAYDRFRVNWSMSGLALQPGEFNHVGTSGSWTAPAKPNQLYKFNVQGGVSAGVSGDYHWSDPSPTISANPARPIISLRTLLTKSNINPSGAKLSALLHDHRKNSLRHLMLD